MTWLGDLGEQNEQAKLSSEINVRGFSTTQPACLLGDRLPPYESGKMIGQCNEECKLRKDTQDVRVHDFLNLLYLSLDDYKALFAMQSS